MTIKGFLKNVVFPIAAVVFLAAVFYPLCVEKGNCEYWKLWILMGIPFGIHRMFLWIIPRGLDIGGTVGMFAFNLLIGGVIGSVVLAWRLVLVVLYLIQGVGSGIILTVGKLTAR